MDRIRREVREIGLVTIFFLGAFSYFLVLKKLLLDEYEVEVEVLGTALVGALVVAKVVVILHKTPLGDIFARSSRLYVHVAWRTFVYTAFVVAVTLAERAFEIYRETGSLASVPGHLIARGDFAHFVAMNLAVGLSLLVYNVFAEIGRHLGEGRLRSLFFGRRVEDSPC